MAIKQFIRITAKPKGGFRRAGMHHPSEHVDHLVEDLEERLTDKQLDALVNEPNLICVPIERDVEDEEGGDPDPATKPNASNARRQSGNRRSGGKGKS